MSRRRQPSGCLALAGLKMATTPLTSGKNRGGCGSGDAVAFMQGSAKSVRKGGLKTKLAPQAKQRPWGTRHAGRPESVKSSHQPKPLTAYSSNGASSHSDATSSRDLQECAVCLGTIGPTDHRNACLAANAIGHTSCGANVHESCFSQQFMQCSSCRDADLDNEVNFVSEPECSQEAKRRKVEDESLQD